LSGRSDFLSSIEYCSIHPGIGVARLGNSPEEFFIGPEVYGSPPIPEGNLFKDRQGRVKRQAVRFHIYAYDSNDKILNELTSDDCSITWNVHLANRKGEAKLFVGKFNQTDAVRNSAVVNRNDLVIDPGLRSISGINQKGNSCKFDTGKFLDVTVPLGEIQTDEKGRLIVLGGFGKSDSVDINKFPIKQYANNDGWFDDTSDGPVTASVTLNNNGKIIAVKETAWIIVAPPKFAPYQYPIVTLYDTMKEVAIEQKWITKPKEVSFMRDIFPLFFRIVQYKWLNETAERGHGINAPGNILTRFKELSTKSDNSAMLRKFIFQKVRNPNLIDNPTSAEAMKQAEPSYMPLLSGDDGEWDNGKFRTFMTILPSQYDNLKKWSEGDFISDFDDSEINNPFEQKRPLEELPIEEQPNALDKANLELSIGGPFFPGIEITYIAGDPSLYNGKPFRINPNLKPGDITKYMAIPWQADFLLCRETWWPIARPDDVIPEGVNDENVDKRKKWARGSDGNEFLDDYLQMVNEWSTLGFIKPKKVGNETFFIESERS
jgi:hypothetical protein